jgi:hypothetical protein
MTTDTCTKTRSNKQYGYFKNIADAESALKHFEQLRAQNLESEEIYRLISNEFTHKQKFVGKYRDTRLLQNSEEIDWLVQLSFLG